MSYFPELDIRIEDKVKGVLDLSNQKKMLHVLIHLI